MNADIEKCEANGVPYTLSNWNHDLFEIFLLIRKGIWNIRDEDGNTFLHYAAHRASFLHDVKIITRVLELLWGVDRLDIIEELLVAQDNEGKIFLHYIGLRTNFVKHVCHWLLEHNAFDRTLIARLREARDNEGKTFLDRLNPEQRAEIEAVLRQLEENSSPFLDLTIEEEPVAEAAPVLILPRRNATAIQPSEENEAYPGWGSGIDVLFECPC